MISTTAFRNQTCGLFRIMYLLVIAAMINVDGYLIEKLAQSKSESCSA